MLLSLFDHPASRVSHHVIPLRTQTLFATQTLVLHLRRVRTHHRSLRRPRRLVQHALLLVRRRAQSRRQSRVALRKVGDVTLLGHLLPVVLDHDVTHLEVAVDDPLRVQVAHALQNPSEDLNRLRLLDRGLWRSVNDRGNAPLRGFLHDDVSADQLLHQNEVVHLVVHDHLVQLHHVGVVEVLQDVCFRAQRLWVSEIRNRDIDRVIAPKPVQLAVRLHGLHVFVDRLERVVLPVLLRVARVDLQLRRFPSHHPAVDTSVNLLQERVLVDAQVVVRVVADHQLHITQSAHSHVHGETHGILPGRSRFGRTGIWKHVGGVALETAVNPHHLLPVARAQRAAKVLGVNKTCGGDEFVRLVLLEDRAHDGSVESKRDHLEMEREERKHVVTADAVVLVSILVVDIRLADNRSGVSRVEGMQTQSTAFGASWNCLERRFG